MSSSGISKVISTNPSSESMESEGDGVIPSQEQVDVTFSRSKQLWQGLYETAASMGLDRDTVNLSHLARKFPALPDDLQGVNELVGQATWEINPGEEDPFHQPRTGEKRRWALTKPQPTECMISDHYNFSFLESKSSGIALLFFGWAYILCLALLERQGVPVDYAESEAANPRDEHRPNERNEITIDIGCVSEQEFRWWTCLLSPGQGWQPTSGQQPVWAATYTGNVKFRLVGQVITSAIPNMSPPSSKEAADFLSRFASMYGLDSQVPLALAMALTLPLHNATSSIVKLPRPFLIRRDVRITHAANVELEYSNLARYMTMSSHHHFLLSALWGVFWEPGLECNLVSPWRDAIIDVIKPLVEGDGFEILGHILALRRPNIAPLWYGMAACGQTKTILAIIPFLQGAPTTIWPTPIPEVAAWTSTSQTFMDTSGSGAYAKPGDLVSREDVWRLRHEFWNLEPEGAHFRYRPDSPWAPFGSMRIDELEIPVRSHIGCDRHYWIYSQWRWFLDNGVVLTEQGFTRGESGSLLDVKPQIDFTSKPPSTPGYCSNHLASQMAVGDIFRWSLTEMELTGKGIYMHPWVQAMAAMRFEAEGEIESGAGRFRVPFDVLCQGIQDWSSRIEVEGSPVEHLSEGVDDMTLTTSVQDDDDDSQSPAQALLQ